MAARKVSHELPDILAALHRQRGQLQTGDPALSPPLEGGDILRRKVKLHHLPQKAACLFLRELEITLPDVSDLSARTQAGQRQGGIFTSGNDQVHLGRLVLQEKGELLVDGQRLDQVVVIEDEHEGLWADRDIVDQAGEQCLRWRRLG